MGIVERIKYDPNRSSWIVLVRWIFGVLLCPQSRTCWNTLREILELTMATIDSLFSFSSLPMEIKDILLLALSSPEAQREAKTSPSLCSLGLPRIVVVGEKPTFFSPQMREELFQKTMFFLYEVWRWGAHSIWMEHRMKCKVALFHQSDWW